MNGRDLKMAYDYLYSIGAVHSQKEFGDAIGRAEETISRDFKAEKKLSASVPYKLLAAFPNVFNESWALQGEGDMLAKQATSAAMPQSDVVAQLIRMCNDLHADVRELKQELASTKAEVEKLKRAHYGYASVAADGMSGIEFEKVK
jgi:hypothetical protein